MAHGNVNEDLQQFGWWLADKDSFLWEILFWNVQAGWLVSQTLFIWKDLGKEEYVI